MQMQYNGRKMGGWNNALGVVERAPPAGSTQEKGPKPPRTPQRRKERVSFMFCSYPETGLNNLIDDHLTVSCPLSSCLQGLY